jgi:hypothetical protein
VLAFIGDQAVAAFDTLLKVLQQLAALRGFQPQRKFGDFDRLGIEIDAMQIVGEDFAVHLARIDLLAKHCEAFVDALKFRREIIEGGDEERPRATCGIDDGEAAQLLPIIQPNGALHLGRPIVGYTFFAFCLDNAVRVANGREALGKSPADGFLDNEARDETGRIDDAIALALGGLGRFLALRLCPHGLDIGNGLLENMSEHADRLLA